MDRAFIDEECGEFGNRRGAHAQERAIAPSGGPQKMRKTLLVHQRGVQMHRLMPGSDGSRSGCSQAFFKGTVRIRKALPGSQQESFG